MRLTTNEMTLISSGVAIAAIVAGYLGVRSANRTAIVIARDERSARQQSEQDALKRASYSAFLLTLSKLTDDQIALDIATKQDRADREELWLRAIQSAADANNHLATLRLVAPEFIYASANAAFRSALDATEGAISPLAEEGEQLTEAMRKDLEAGRYLR